MTPSLLTMPLSMSLCILVACSAASAHCSLPLTGIPTSRCSPSHRSRDDPAVLPARCLQSVSHPPGDAQSSSKRRLPPGPRCRKWAPPPTPALLQQWYGSPPPRGGPDMREGTGTWAPIPRKRGRNGAGTGANGSSQKDGSK
ncbi:uncharacterized protein AAGF69_012479 isoform 1-T2 [Amazona ochrocephala]